MMFIIVFLNVLLKLLSFAIIIRVLLSWVNADKGSLFYTFVRDITEPIIGFFRRFIPPIGMIDLSPVAALFAIDLIQALINNLQL